MKKHQLEEEMRHFHEKTVWTRFALLALSVWLLMFPATFGYESKGIFISDLVCGVLLFVLSFLALSVKRVWPSLALAGVGLWMQVAPLVFWAKQPVIYLNETLVGILVVSLAVLIYQDPRDYLVKGPTIPKGWSYNPSSWRQRMPILFFGLVCWFSARYMGNFQLGYLSVIWDPIFVEGTHRVITSDISKAFPVPDAALGAFGYTLELLMGCQGSERRWYTMPWSVVIFGILVVPLSVVSIVLIILQPLIVGYWCFWCLLTAVAMLVMLALTLDEVAAVIQYLYEVKQSKQSFWRTFWLGGKDVNGEYEKPVVNKEWKVLFKESLLGITWEPTLTVCAILGAVLMALPEQFSYSLYVANSNYILGALITVVAVSAMAEVGRVLRYMNIGLGGLLILLTWVLWGSSLGALLCNTAIGALVILLSFKKGRIKHSYGIWDRWVF